MNTNEQLIQKFYTAFSQRDYKTMQSCYADHAVFNDAVFRDLDSAQVKAMWEMLCVKGKGADITFSNVKADDHTGSAEWIATYDFSLTGKKVVNHVVAHFVFEQGKIVVHTDTFNFYRWAKQAFGFTGVLLGWTPLLSNKVRKTARKNLDEYMRR